MLQGRADRLTFLLATGIVALLFHPLRQRLQWTVNHLMYGERDDPYTVLSRLGQQLGGTLAPGTTLTTLVETIAQTLRLPYAALALRQGESLAVVASVGAQIGNSVRVPIAHQGKPIAELLLAPRPGERSFSPSDRRLLEDLAYQAGIALHAVQLAVDLQHSRERLVTAREEERRRLRRDLHDGLGPALASIQLNLNAIRHLLQPGSPAEPIILQTRSDIQAVIADIRRLVYELRPPALDELGLLGAVRQAAAACEHDGLLVSIEEIEGLSPLPAAVEVAAYRIIQEALTNVVRHAHARRCAVRLAVTGCLEVEITDDGVGLAAERQAGVGLTSMRERAAELGGSCVVEAVPAGGTRVYACLPLPDRNEPAPARPAPPVSEAAGPMVPRMLDAKS
jgi:signal transduction histidine kinase